MIAETRRPTLSGLIRLASVVLGACCVFVAGCAPVVAEPPAPQGPDQTASLQQRLDALKPGDTLTMDPTTYAHSGVLRIRVPGVVINGNGGTLQATNEATSSVQVTADNVTIKNLKLTAPHEGQRWDKLDQQKLAILGTRGVHVRDVAIDGSAAAGIYVGQGATAFDLTNVTVSNTRADGIHITGGANNGTVTHATTNQTGDDGVAVVSYGGDPAPSRQITINGPTVNGTTNGRGVSVVGGEQVAIRDVNIHDTSGAGIYIATEGDPYNTGSVHDVSVVGGTIARANYAGDTVNGAVLVYGGAAQALRSVTISGLSISDTPASAERDVGLLVDRGTAAGIEFADLHLSGTAVQPFVTNVASAAFTTRNWTVDGQPVTVN